jgi:hypothetical protein
LLESRRRQLDEQLQLRERAEVELKTIAGIEARVRELNKELEERQRNRPSRDEVVEAVGRQYAEVLESIQFPDVSGVRVDDRAYIPIVRNQPYGELSSRGAIALAVTAWHIALLQYSLTAQTLFPGVFLLDSPLSNVGHDAADKAFRDQRIVDSFYAPLLNLHRSSGSSFS